MLRGDGITRFCLVQISAWYVRIEPRSVGHNSGAAILIDVAIVRMIIIPPVMTLAGRTNRWFPSWLNRFLPRRDIEGGHSEPQAARPVR